MPTKQQIQKVIDTLEASIKVVGVGVDMSQGRVTHDDNTLCDTVFCHGGHYLIGYYTLQGLCVPAWKLYSSGVQRMAEDLGLGSEEGIANYYTENDDLWGNNFAAAMFVHREAFKSDTRPGGARDLNDIIQHWKEVKERTPE